MAKKKYYQNRKDRRDESRGMERYENEMSGMIKEDLSAPSNLPQEKVMKYYPKCEYLMQDDYPDTLREVDMQIDDDVRGARKHRSKTKY